MIRHARNGRRARAGEGRWPHRARAESYASDLRFNGREAVGFGVCSCRPRTSSPCTVTSSRSWTGCSGSRWTGNRAGVRQHDRFVRSRSARSVHHAARGDRPRVPGRVPVPPELARDDHPDARDPGVAGRHVRVRLAPRLLDQHADAVRHGARDRHRRRRRDRRGRERRADHARGRADRRARRRSRRWPRSSAPSSRSC